MAAHKRIFILIDKNVIRYINEWHYFVDFYPEIYYYYDVQFTAKYKFDGTTKKFVWYKRI